MRSVSGGPDHRMYLVVECVGSKKKANTDRHAACPCCTAVYSIPVSSTIDKAIAALEAGGGRAITFGANTTAGDDIIFVYSDGTDSFVVAGSIGSTAATITAAALTETTLLKLSGIDHTELGSLASTNFDFV